MRELQRKPVCGVARHTVSWHRRRGNTAERVSGQRWEVRKWSSRRLSALLFGVGTLQGCDEVRWCLDESCPPLLRYRRGAEPRVKKSIKADWKRVYFNNKLLRSKTIGFCLGGYSVASIASCLIKALRTKGTWEIENETSRDA